MINYAKEKASKLHLTIPFQTADVMHLDYESESFDKCHVDRVLQHVIEPECAIREIVRGTKQSGKIVIAEPDWGLLLLIQHD